MKKIFFPVFFFITASLCAFPGLSNEPGSHYDITQTSLKEDYDTTFGKIITVRMIPLFGIERYDYENARLSDIICYASGGPDLYYFGKLFPHSMTEDYDYSKDFTEQQVVDIEKAALDKYFDYVSYVLNLFVEELSEGHNREAAYMLGFYLHTYEDLFSHNGITDSQHLYLNELGVNPDYSKDNYDQAVEGVKQFLETFPENIYDSTLKDKFMFLVTSDKVVDVLSPSEVKELLGRKMDIYWEGIKYQFFTSSSEDCMKYCDQIRWDSDAIIKLMNTKEGLGLVLAYGSKHNLQELLDYSGYEF
ncbi:MAG: hypothetical protein PQJ46_13050 [Spirochaetales bacterium]|nr:hypothetical protein [Spirochaetales bacterium]